MAGTRQTDSDFAEEFRLSMDTIAKQLANIIRATQYTELRTTDYFNDIVACAREVKQIRQLPVDKQINGLIDLSYFISPITALMYRLKLSQELQTQIALLDNNFKALQASVKLYKQSKMSPPPVTNPVLQPPSPPSGNAKLTDIPENIWRLLKEGWNPFDSIEPKGRPHKDLFDFFKENPHLINLKGENGNTILHLAALANNDKYASFIESMIALGADPTIPNVDEKKSAIDIAWDNGPSDTTKKIGDAVENLDSNTPDLQARRARFFAAISAAQKRISDEAAPPPAAISNPEATKTALRKFYEYSKRELDPSIGNVLKDVVDALTGGRLASKTRAAQKTQKQLEYIETIAKTIPVTHQDKEIIATAQYALAARSHWAGETKEYHEWLKKSANNDYPRALFECGTDPTTPPAEKKALLIKLLKLDVNEPINLRYVKKAVEYLNQQTSLSLDTDFRDAYIEAKFVLQPKKFKTIPEFIRVILIQGKDPLAKISEYGNKNLIEFFKDHPNLLNHPLDGNRNRVLHSAIMNTNISEVSENYTTFAQEMIMLGADPTLTNKGKQSALFVCIRDADDPVKGAIFITIGQLPVARRERLKHAMDEAIRDHLDKTKGVIPKPAERGFFSRLFGVNRSERERENPTVAVDLRSSKKK